MTTMNEKFSGETINKIVENFDDYLEFLSFDILIRVAAIANLYRLFLQSTEDQALNTIDHHRILFDQAIASAALYESTRLDQVEPLLSEALSELLAISNERSTNQFVEQIQTLITRSAAENPHLKDGRGMPEISS